MLCELAALLIGALDGTARCEEARHLYEALSLEAAIQRADAVLAEDPARPLACLEVRGLGSLILGQVQGARESLAELFTRDPQRRVEDPALSPAMRETIETIRESVRPISVRVEPRWLIHESLRIDVLLEGGLRNAERIQYRALLWPARVERRGTLVLLGRTASATIAVARGAPLERLEISGVVVDGQGKELHAFQRTAPLPPRLPAIVPSVVEVESTSRWPLWAGLGVAATAVAVAVVILAQPQLPDTRGTLGRIDLEP